MKCDICISVIIPICNAAVYLDHCLRSVIEQTYRQLEIILVDDGSTDDSLAICRRYEREDRRVRVFHQSNRGAGDARELGIRHAGGEYLTFVDADDYIDLDAYQTVMNRMDTELPDIVSYGLVEEYADHRIVRQDQYADGLYDRDALEKEIFPTMLSHGAFFGFGILPNLVCKLIKRTFYESAEVRISQGISFGEDADVVFQLLVRAKTLRICHIAPYRYNKRSDSMTWKKMDKNAIESLRSDLEGAFRRQACYDILAPQMERYIAFVTLLKKPDEIAEIRDVFETTERRMALYGAGGFGQALYGQYGDKISLWVDKNDRRYADTAMPVYGIERLLQDAERYDVVYIAILNMPLCGEIKRQLEAMGIGKPILFYGSEDCVV